MAGRIGDIASVGCGEIARELGLDTFDTITVLLAPDEATYRSFHGDLLPEWSAAFADMRAQTLGINAAAVLRVPRPLTTVVRHELSHLLLAQRLRGARCPRWFAEGLAMFQSGEWTFADQWGLMAAVGGGDLPYLDELAQSFPAGEEAAALAYRISYVAVEELLRGNKASLATVTAFTRDLGDFREAFISTYGETPEGYGVRLRGALIAKYRAPAAVMRSSPYWLGLSLLLIAAYVIKRVRGRRKLREWAELGDDAY
jgi:hypothetical protein